MKILISGGTGFVGTKLVKKLSSAHEVILLSRNSTKVKDLFSSTVQFIEWSDYYKEFDLSSFGKIDAVINLMGENIGEKKWTNEQKKSLFNSRVDATKTIISSVKKNQDHLNIFISTSANGIYTDGFLKKLCEQWEKVVLDNSSFIKRTCILRVGMVLGDGGAMNKMLPPFRLGLGGKMGDGKQWMSWVHITDLVNMYSECLENTELSGQIDAVSAFPVTNEEFTDVLGKLLRKKTPFTVPKVALKLLMGEMSCLVLDSIKQDPAIFKNIKFHYLFPTIEIALKDVVSKQ